MSSVVLVPVEYNIVFNSDPASGSTGLSASGDSFYTNSADSPIIIPADAINPTVSMVNASVWNNVSNVIAGVNDQVTLQLGGVPQTITIPAGSYSVSDINTAINTAITAINPAYANAVEFRPNFATDKVEIVRLTAQFDLYIWNTNLVTEAFSALIGWNANSAVYTFNGQVQTGALIAQINVVDNFLIHTSLISDGGLQLNGNFYNILSSVPITVAPGGLINYEPRTPIKISGKNIRNPSGVTQVRSWITNQNNQSLTMPSYWSFTVKIEYSVPLVLGKT